MCGAHPSKQDYTNFLHCCRFVNTDTLIALQVLQSQSHPDSHNQGPTKNATRSKEGLSVYGLFHNLACTPQGKSILRRYFLRPSLDLTVINERLDTISTFLRPDNQAHLKDITKSLRQVKNMRTVLVHIKKGVSSGLSKGGGIKNGVWSTLRSVFCLVLRTHYNLLNMSLVRLPYSEHQGYPKRYCWG